MTQSVNWVVDLTPFWENYYTPAMIYLWETDQITIGKYWLQCNWKIIWSIQQLEDWLKYIKEEVSQE